MLFFLWLLMISSFVAGPCGWGVDALSKKSEAKFRCWRCCFLQVRYVSQRAVQAVAKSDHERTRRTFHFSSPIFLPLLSPHSHVIQCYGNYFVLKVNSISTSSSYTIYPIPHGYLSTQNNHNTKSKDARVFVRRIFFHSSWSDPVLPHLEEHCLRLNNLCSLPCTK